MKRREIQNILNDSLQAKTPVLSKKILRTPINTSDNAFPVESKYYAKKKKSILSWVSAVACVLVVVVIASICGVYFANVNADKPVVTMQTTCYEVDINPSVIITADKDGKVLHIASQNADADVVLSGKAFNNYTEMTVEQCIQTFIEESAKLGFIDCNSGDNNININLINGEKSKKRTKLASQIQDDIQQYLMRSNILGYVSSTTTEVKDFVEQKGWAYSDNNIDSYMSSIKKEYKYSSADEVAQSIMQNLENDIKEFLARLEKVMTLLDEMDRINSDIESLSGKDYWECKLIEDSFLFGSQLTNETKTLIAQGDKILEDLEEYDVYVTSSASLVWQLLKYDIIDETKNLVQELKEDISDSYIVGLLLSQIQGIDSELYENIKNDLAVYYNEVVAVLNNLYNERIAKYLDIFQSRPTISSQDYEQYLASKR